MPEKSRRDERGINGDDYCTVAPRPASYNEPIHAQIKPQRQPAESYVNETDKGNLAEIYGDTPSVPKRI